jgi:hypothetical protein
MGNSLGFPKPARPRLSKFKYGHRFFKLHGPQHSHWFCSSFSVLLQD